MQAFLYGERADASGMRSKFESQEFQMLTFQPLTHSNETIVLFSTSIGIDEIF